MKRREFFKKVGAPIVVAACGFKLTSDQTIMSWHPTTIVTDDLIPEYQIGDLCYVPRTGESMVLMTIKDEEMVWSRHLGGSGADQEVRKDDAVWIIGSTYREERDEPDGD